MPAIIDLEKTKYGVEGHMHCALTNEDINVMLHDDVSEEYAQRCAEMLNSLPPDVVNNICKAAMRYYFHQRQDIGEDVDALMSVRITKSSNPLEILQCIRVGMLIVNKPKDERIGFHVECGCDWEEEHGLEFTILDGKLVYLGSYEDSRAWKEYPADDVWNYVNDIERKF